MAELDLWSVGGWEPKRGILADAAGALDRLEDIGQELVSLKCWGLLPGAHVKNHCHWGETSINHLSLPTNGR